MAWNRGEQTVYLRGRVNDGLRLPRNEDREGARLNRQHQLLAAVAGKRHYFAPVTNPKAILDVASGTGIWGVEMALHFRQATIDNTDSNQDMAEQWLRYLTAHQPGTEKPSARCSGKEPWDRKEGFLRLIERLAGKSLSFKVVCS